MKFSFTLIWKGISIIPDKQKAYRSKIRNVSKGHSSSLPPLRFCWKKWINYSTSKEEEKKSESFPSVAYVPSLSLPWGHRLTWRMHLREGTAHTQLSPVLPATGEADSTTPCMHEQRETAQRLKLGGCQDPCATCLSYVLQASFISNKVYSDLHPCEFVSTSQ